MPERYNQVTSLQDTDYIKVVINPDTRDSQDAKITVTDFFTQILPSRNISATGINMIEAGNIIFDDDGGTILYQGNGEILFTGQGRVKFGDGGSLTNDGGKLRLYNAGGSENDVLTVDGHYEVGGVQVVGARGGAISNPTGGGTQDAEARTAIVSILSLLRAHGLCAT